MNKTLGGDFEAFKKFCAPASPQVQQNPAVVNLRCPHCAQMGAFHRYNGASDIAWAQRTSAAASISPYAAGMRSCPNLKCLGLVFVVLSADGIKSYPSELKKLETHDLPERVRDAIEEAVKCHASECYRAAALMVRRTLEEMCDDRGAVGDNLHKRIDGLKKQIVISQDLIDGAHELRFLGNDAAHVEAKIYSNVGKDETDVAIDLAIELLRATYQTKALVNRLKAFKTPTTP